MTQTPALQLAIADGEKNPRTFERGDPVDIAENWRATWDTRRGPATGIVLSGPHGKRYSTDHDGQYEVLVGTNKHFIHWVYLLKIGEDGEPIYDERVHSMDRIALGQGDLVNHIKGVKQS